MIGSQFYLIDFGWSSGSQIISFQLYKIFKHMLLCKYNYYIIFYLYYSISLCKLDTILSFSPNSFLASKWMHFCSNLMFVIILPPWDYWPVEKSFCWLCLVPRCNMMIPLAIHIYIWPFLKMQLMSKTFLFALEYASGKREVSHTLV